MLNKYLPLARFLLWAVATTCASTAALANMELSNVILHFEAGDPSRQDVEISNPGDTPLYVEIEPRMVLSPGEEGEERRRITDPRSAGLLVTPNKLIIPPGATKAVRFVKLGPSTAERVYRVAAKPVIGDIEAEQSGLKILIGYEILVIVYPDETTPNLEVSRDGQQFTVVNSGNANVLLREGYQCAEPGLPVEDCTPLPGKRMYPGNQWSVELPHDLPVTYYQGVGTRNFVEVYP
jgi:P pilus assembly chaperone PapD